MTVIALDYDHTFTTDPEMWTQFAKDARKRGHMVHGVTMRRRTESATMDDAFFYACNCVIFTGRKAKKPYCDAIGLPIDIWIDDTPEWILTDSR